MEDERPATAEVATWSRVAGWVGVVAHVVIGGYLTLLSGLVAPTWGVVVIGLVMVALLALGLMTVRRHRWVLLALPVAAVLAWVIVIAIGEAAFGWTA